MSGNDRPDWDIFAANPLLGLVCIILGVVAIAGTVLMFVDLAMEAFP